MNINLDGDPFIISSDDEELVRGFIEMAKFEGHNVSSVVKSTSTNRYTNLKSDYYIEFPGKNLTLMQFNTIVFIRGIMTYFQMFNKPPYIGVIRRRNGKKVNLLKPRIRTINREIMIKIIKNNDDDEDEEIKMPISTAVKDIIDEKYFIGRKIGEGGEGIVFEGIRKKDDIHVAIKFTDVSYDESFISLKEIKKKIDEGSLDKDRIFEIYDIIEIPHNLTDFYYVNPPNKSTVIIMELGTDELAMLIKDTKNASFEEKVKLLKFVIEEYIEIGKMLNKAGYFFTDASIENMLMKNGKLAIIDPMFVKLGKEYLSWTQMIKGEIDRLINPRLSTSIVNSKEEAKRLKNALTKK